MKTHFLTLLILVALVKISGAQPVIYKCINYEFKNEKDPSKDIEETDLTFVSLDLNLDGDPCFKLTLNKEAEKSEDIVLKWNIKTSLGITSGTAKNIIKTSYIVKKEVMGVEKKELLYLYKTEDTITKTLDITISDPDQKTTWNFYALMRE